MMVEGYDSGVFPAELCNEVGLGLFACRRQLFGRVEDRAVALDFLLAGVLPCIDVREPGRHFASEDNLRRSLAGEPGDGFKHVACRLWLERAGD